MAAGEFELMEQIYGFTYNPHTILLNASLAIQAVSSCMYDWAHGYVSKGVADDEWGAFMQWMHRNTDTQYEELAGYVASWTIPKSFGKLGHVLKRDACAKKNAVNDLPPLRWGKRQLANK